MTSLFLNILWETVTKFSIICSLESTLSNLPALALISILFVMSIILCNKGYGVRLGLACIIFYAKPGSRGFPHGVEIKFTTRFIDFIRGWFQGPLIDIYAEKFFMELSPSSSSSLSSSPVQLFSSPLSSLSSLWSSFLSSLLSLSSSLLSSLSTSSLSATCSSSTASSLQSSRKSDKTTMTPSRVLKFILASFQVVEGSYLTILILNAVSGLLACFVRFLRVRIGKVHLWKDRGSWELKVGQVIFSGHAYNLVGCKYNLSFDELLFNYIKTPANDPCPLQPIQLSFGLQHGIEIEARLEANIFSIFRNKRFVILDDLTTSLKATKISAFSPRILQLSIDHLNVHFSPGHSRSLLAKLPSFPPPSTNVPKPSLLMYWESNIVVKKVAFMFNAPTELPKCASDFRSPSMGSIFSDPSASREMFPSETSSRIGFFFRLNHLKLDSYGKTAQEKREPMINVSLGLSGCSAGSTSIDKLSQKMYEEAQVEAGAGLNGPMENIEKLINAKPELLLRIEDVSFSFNMNCTRHYLTRMDVGGTGVVFAIDPVGLVTVISKVRGFVQNYFERKHMRQPVTLQDPAEIPSSSAHSSGNSDGCDTAIISQPQSIRVVCDIRNWTSLVLGTGTASDGDTLAMVACCDEVLLSNVDFMNSSVLNMVGSLQQFELIHWNRWGATKTIVSEMSKVKIQNSDGQDQKLVELINTHVNWGVDAHCALEMMPSVFSSLKQLCASNSPLKSFENANGAVWTPPSSDSKSMRLANTDSKYPNQTEKARGRDEILSWHVKGQSISLSISFPDGPKMQLDMAEVPKLQLNAKTIVAHHVVVTLQSHKFAYVEKLQVGSPLHATGKDTEKRNVDIDIHNFVLILGNEEQFGHLLQDWILRFKTGIRFLGGLKLKRKGMGSPRSKSNPMVDVHLKCSNTEICFEDLQATRTSSQMANGYLSDMQQPPAASFIATSFSVDIAIDDNAREYGSKEILRKMKTLDEYELGTKKHNKARQYDMDAWNSIVFRTVHFEATGVSVQLRDYPLPLLTIDRLYFNNAIMGQAVQATVPPFVSHTTIAIGKRRLVKIVKGLAPTKLFIDVHVKTDRLHCHVNPSYLVGTADVGKTVASFFSGGKNPSPKIPWFDSLRVSMHGRMRLTAKKFTGDITSATSPCSITDRFLEIEFDDFEMFASRLESTENDPFPLSLKFHNWRIRPSTFGIDNNRRSEIIFDLVRVGLTPTFTVNSGDPHDHYFVPFPTKEEVLKGGLGIGRETITLLGSDEPVHAEHNEFGNFTDWLSDLHYIPGHDTFADYKTRSMILGIDVLVRHAESDLKDAEHSKRIPTPEVSSILHSDAISNMYTSINKIIQTPVPCQPPPRMTSPQRQPPSETGLSTCLRGLDVKVDVQNLNLMMYNNLEPGHSLFLSIDSLNGEFSNCTNISLGGDGQTIRKSTVTRRTMDIVNIYSSVQVPALDMAFDSNNMGKLLTVDKISLSDNLPDEISSAVSPTERGGHAPSSGFGTVELDNSPFYTCTTNHPFQRGNPLEKFNYDKRLVIDGVRLIWSPCRMISMFSWPDAFEAKPLCTNAPGSIVSELDNQSDDNSRQSISLFDEKSGQGRNKKSTTSNMEQLMNGVGRKAGTSSGRVSTDSQISEDISVESRETASLDSSIHRWERISAKKGDPRCTSADNSQKGSVPKSTVQNNRKHFGSMTDLLSPSESNLSPTNRNDQKSAQEASSNGNNGFASKNIFAVETLESDPKFALCINDFEAVCGTPESSSHVFLRSQAMRAGIVDKKVQHCERSGLDKGRWIDREFRFHLDSAAVYTRDKAKGKIDLNSRNWVEENLGNGTMSLLTQPPISADLLYITPSSLPSEDGGDAEVDDASLRPSQLLINVPRLKLSTNASEFQAITDVVRKVLVQSTQSSEVVAEELSKLRYKIQLKGGKVSTKKLEQYLAHLNSIVRQLLYADDTSQHHLAKKLMLSDEKTFADTLQRYKAKAKAVVTFLRKDQIEMNVDAPYPTMYISCSFDECSWELREAIKQASQGIDEPFVSITLENLVCRHIFCVGRGSSTEVTFENIRVDNKMQNAYFKTILQPASGPASRTSASDSESKPSSGIYASDGSTVAFRLYVSQEGRVGQMPAYDIRLQAAPMTATVTRRLFTSVHKFFSATKLAEGPSKSTEQEPQQTKWLRSVTSLRRLIPFRTVRPSPQATNSSHVFSHAHANHCDQREPFGIEKHNGEANIIFSNILIDAFSLGVSYKHKENGCRGLLDVSNLSVTTPSVNYSEEIWTWNTFSAQLHRDLVRPAVSRGVKDLAKLKLLPGYNLLRRRRTAGRQTVRQRLSNAFHFLSR